MHKESPKYTSENWYADAACAGVDNPDIFFRSPKKGGDMTTEERAEQRLDAKNGNIPPAYRAAKRICAKCPVISFCLNDALRHDGSDSEGVFGGLSAPERRAVKKLPEGQLRDNVIKNIHAQNRRLLPTVVRRHSS